MPYGNSQLTPEGATPAQPAALIAGMTLLLAVVLGKQPQITDGVLDAVETDNGGSAGESVTERRWRGA